MSGAMICLYADFCCSVVLALCGSWLLTDRHLRRLLRVCHALITAGALTNVLGIVADRLGYENVSYGHIWPGELITNIGTAVLMSAWVWRSVQRRLQAGKST